MLENCEKFRSTISIMPWNKYIEAYIYIDIEKWKREINLVATKNNLSDIIWFSFC